MEIRENEVQCRSCKRWTQKKYGEQTYICDKCAIEIMKKIEGER